mmetsp:Transcript_34876/g.76228  ORF Transcript_34876/g.76228 Transcript_34876/m.76228 type:complete len:289 (+) Transcript_34876:275-1141(+)|eukprot:CAMPEP_0118929074 /NCGR_PEP_ID=MMETSP1169-20130426/6176_1 /TAXON_ID=36882 /ORGANISM="Pyramimonas obovata, Strain CCMP722" /LENGTH=288 /DNA_ID=CAMNT_0006871197 /DNA_START=239 /DNA_END=1105 /DNA_ORIENTATION=-
MASSCLRQRGNRHSDLHEPLLAEEERDEAPGSNGKKEKELSFPLNYLNGCFKMVVDIVRHFPFFSKSKPPVVLSDIQYRRLQDLWERIRIPYDSNNEEHQEELRRLWKLAFPDKPLPAMKTPLWKDMGWQGEDPATDFRSGGFISLQQLIFLGERFPSTFRRLLNKEEGIRSDWEYPFAVAGLNVTFMLTELLELRKEPDVPQGDAFRGFAKLLENEEDALEVVYAATFELLDYNWLKQRASYMEFPNVMNATKSTVASALASQEFSTGEKFLEHIRCHAEKITFPVP